MDRDEKREAIITVIITISIIGLLVGIVFLCKSCVGNKQIFDGMTGTTNTYTYAEVRMPDGTIKEGVVKQWADYESDALKIIFEDGTDLITTYNCAVLSKGKVNR